MQFKLIDPSEDLSPVVHVLNEAHGTVARQFGFSKEDNPSNNAFITATELKKQLEKGVQLYALFIEDKLVGCIGIEPSSREIGTFYIEKVSVLPEYREKGLGVELMKFAEQKIKEFQGKKISIALIDSHARLKNWYLNQGFEESSTKDFEHLPFRVCFMKKDL